MRRPKPAATRTSFSFLLPRRRSRSPARAWPALPLRRKTSIGCCGASSTRPSARISSTSSATCGCCPIWRPSAAQMTRHRAVIRPKFEMALNAFATELCGLPGVSWTKPNGGYFISLDLPDGCASRAVALARKPALYSRPPAPPSLTDGIRRTPTSASRLHIRRSPSWKRRWT